MRTVWQLGASTLVIGLVLAATDRLEALQQVPAVRIVAVEGEGGRYWPRWRGPSGQGIVTGSGYVNTWSATENVLWKKAVPGNGNSSPIVWGDRVFLTTAQDGGRTLALLAYRRTDGSLLWESVVPTIVGRRVESVRGKNGNASATASTDGERIYVSFGNRGLLAFDFTGKVVWHRDLGATSNYWGTAGSPLLYKDRVILYQDQNQNAFIAAFDTKTGKDVWRTARTERVGWGTPVAIHSGSRDEIIVNGQNSVVAYNPDNGQELYRNRYVSGTERISEEVLRRFR